MLFGSSWRLAVPLIMACALLPCGATALPEDSQDQQTQSVADAARRAREQKKTAAKSSKVITEDDLGTKSSVPGAEDPNAGAPPKPDSQPPTSAAVATAEAADQTAAPAAKESPRRAGEDPEIAAVREQIKQVQKELDLLQRELALDQDAYFSKPDYASDKSGKGKLDAEKQRVNDKQQELERLKTRLAALQELQDHKRPAPAAATPPADNDKPTAPPAPPQP